MSLISRSNREINDLSPIKKLYNEAFPKEERLPWWIMRLLTVKDGIEFTAYYDNETFCGFTYSITEGDILFVYFLAVADGLRGKGYGSAILGYLKKNNEGKTITLNVEPLDENAENAQQRKNRMRFYQKNGFHDTGYDVKEVGGKFRIMSTEKELDKEAYLRIFGKISFGLWKPPITECNNGEK